MYEDTVRQYVRQALQRHHPVEDIIGRLTGAGHKEEIVRRIAREEIRTRLSQLEQHKQSLLVRKRLPEHVLVSVLLRVGLGVVGAVALSAAVLNAVYHL